MCADGGVKIVYTVRYYSSTLNLTTITFVMLLAVGHVYGANKFCKDLRSIVIKKDVFGLIPKKKLRGKLVFCWKFLTPLVVVSICIYDIFEYVFDSLQSHKTNRKPKEVIEETGWAEYVGILLWVVVHIAIVAPMVLMIIKADGSFRQRLKILTCETLKWRFDLEDNVTRQPQSVGKNNQMTESVVKK